MRGKSWLLLVVHLSLPWIFLSNSINRPSICPYATWNSNGSLVDRINPSNRDIQALFIDYNNHFFLGDMHENEVYIWPESIPGSMATLFIENNTRPTSIFKYSISELYVAHAGAINGITRWTSSVANGTFVTSTDGLCWGLYVTTDTLFCTLSYTHEVMVFALNTSSRWSIDLGEKGVCGATATELCFPTGLFWLNDAVLYVADTDNDRIQTFRFNDTAAETVVGISGTMVMDLSRPTAVIADGLDRLIIADSNNKRIVCCASWSGCKSIIEESDLSSSSFRPSALTLDRFGNLYSLTQTDGLIHKFNLEKNSCGK